MTSMTSHSLFVLTVTRIHFEINKRGLLTGSISFNFRKLNEFVFLIISKTDVVDFSDIRTVHFNLKNE